jgi:sporulation protein YabP
MSEERRASKHKLTIEHKENVTITGVVDVISFDEEQVVCDTDMGVLILRGINLHVSNLNLDSGLLDIFGEIVSVNYEEYSQSQGKGRSRSTLLGRIFK